ncbi:hypothetical protein NDU88_000576 [Pleurodeles waltl]|uniref:Uncharacterized protein n=1 Tax=Pleurodeles waltl TaxID=8319 RepID=A0AAV7UQD1_PLEWA|nr:hypothetical protein NDU88_000576 [Pleurodeles waltl]
MNTGASLRTRFVAAGGTAGRGGTRAIGPRTAGDAKGVPPAAAGSLKKSGDDEWPTERVEAARHRGDGATRELATRPLDWRWSSGPRQTPKK